ncbi:MAG TPA: hypothetical protein VF599_16190 [Pyrinomonadaceae bacterium]|jgi:hypothetical protein
MRITTPKPINSEIQSVDDFNRTVIWWKNPRGGASRYLIALFMLGWLGGWAMGEYFALMQVLSGNPNLFILFWLIAWTAGGVFAMRHIYFLLRPTKAEKIILDTTSLIFEAGTTPFGGVSFQGFNKRRNNEDDDALPVNSKSKYIVPKTDVGAIKLERVGERQRLTFDYGAERVEVGFFLKEPEREWLFSVLKQWKGV